MESGFGEDDYYRLLAEAHATEEFVLRSAAIARQALGDRRRIGIGLHAPHIGATALPVGVEGGGCAA